MQLLRSITAISSYTPSFSTSFAILLLLAYNLNSNDPPFEPISHIYATHTPLKRHILYLKHSNAQRKVYHSMPLHTYTANFATSSNISQTFHLFNTSYL